MKARKIIILERVLRFMALAVLKKYQPLIVGITGSVGKTSAKEAIFAVLKNAKRVRKNEKNYNNEIGIPLTIIGVETGGRSPLAWTKIFLHWAGMLIFPVEYPEVLVLEMGVDRPGDMQYLTSFIVPFVGVVTNISSSHLEFFRGLEHIAQEKGILLEKLPQEGFAVLNIDDEKVTKMITRTKASVFTCGEDLKAVVNASNVKYYYENGMPDGISFKLNYNGKTVPIRLKKILAHHQVGAALAAVAVGLSFKLNLVDIAVALENFNPPASRLNLFKGIKFSNVIDDTYNASPTSTMAALDVLKELEAQRKIAVLGDMLELGKEEEVGHARVVCKVMEDEAALFFAVGHRMQKACETNLPAEFIRERVSYFASSIEAGEKLAGLVQKGDLILVKGSQGMRMEKAVEKLLANPEDLQHVCRQSKDWKKIPFGNP